MRTRLLPSPSSPSLPPPAELLAALPQQVWLLQPDLRPLYANARLLEFAGLSLAQLQQRGWTELLHPEDRPAFLGAWTAAQLSGRFEIDTRLRAADGRHVWHLVLATPLAGSGLWLGTHGDIDARKQAEARLREADALWKLALESNGDGVWDWHVQTGVELYSARYLQMYGFEADEIRPTPQEFDARTHPDDVAQMARDREAHFAGLTAIYSNEHRVRCKDGSWKWILSRGMVISRDEQGQPLRMVGTHTDITERKHSEAVIWQQARYDALTGLPNRRMLREWLEQQLPARRAGGITLALLFIDLDHFKEVNDSLGHDLGDALLVQAAQRIQACLGPGDLVARMGGDEFTVVLDAIADAAAAERRAQQIIGVLATAFELQGERAFVSASVGISLFPRDGGQIEELLKHADQALYVAKAAGRNRLSHFTPALQQAALTRARLSKDLRAALAGQQFSLAYQPIVELASGAIHKAEALLRWQHPSRGAIAPASFIGMAERNGLIIEIGEWVFEQAAQQLRQWRTQHDPTLQLSINKSPVQFRSEGSSGSTDWPRRLAELGLPGEAIAIEITEGLLLEADAAVTSRLQSLREAGMPISLDDFGTGYSSLSYLQQYPIDLIKIDRSFIRGLAPGAKALALCKAIIAMAHELGIKVVAEGIETQEQRDLLLAAGCDYGQGCWFARPLPAREFEALLWSGKA